MDIQFPQFLTEHTVVTYTMLEDDQMRARLANWIASDYTGENAETFDPDLIQSIEMFISPTPGNNGLPPRLSQLSAEYRDMASDD